MVEIGLFWTLLLLAGMVTTVVWLVKLLFPASGGSRRDSRGGTDVLSFVDRPYLADRRDQDNSDKPGRGPDS